MDNQEKNSKSVGEKAAEVVEKVQKAQRTIKRLRWLSMLIPSPIILLKGLLLFTIIIVALAPVVMWGQIKEGVLTTTEKLLNFITFNGWNDNEKAFFNNLQKAYEKYDSYNNKEGELDVSLISATIHYRKMIPTVTDFEQAGKVETAEYDSENDSPIIPINQMRNFYKVANERLGEIGENATLLGELVGTKIVMQCYPIGDNTFDTIDSIANWLGNFSETIFTGLGDSLASTLKNTIGLPANAVNEFFVMYSYYAEDQDYLKEKYLQLFSSMKNNDAVKLIRASDIRVSCGEAEFAMPTIYKFMDYENYKRHLKEVLLPVMLKKELAGKTSDQKESILNQAVEEIFQMKETADRALRNASMAFNGNYGESVFHIPGFSGFDILFPAKTSYRISSEFGYRTYTNNSGQVVSGYHYGIDLAAVQGTDVLVAGPGIVDDVGFDGSRGNYVIIRHDLNNDDVIDYYTTYYHLKDNSIIVSEKQKVSYGQKIAEVGSTGRSTGPHLHFEIWRASNKSKLNPAEYIGVFAPSNTIASGSSKIQRGTVITRGEMTGYLATCEGCTGIVSCPVGGQPFSLFNSLTYSDPVYGNLRIFAADHSLLPCGTIIEVSNHKTLGSFRGIVLDTGSAMRNAAKENRILLDLAVATVGDALRTTHKHEQQALIYDSIKSVSNDMGVYYEVLRYGW